MKGIIAFDIDGTLTHRLDWIDLKVVQFLKELVADQWQVAFLTGRIFSFAWQILQHFPFPYLLGVQNGADILEMPSKKFLKRNYLSSQILPQIELAYHGQQEDFIIYAGIEQGDFCYFRPERFSKKVLQYLKVLESLSASKWQPSNFIFEEKMVFPLIKTFGQREAMKRLNLALEMNPTLEASLIRDPIDTTLYLNLITHQDANKGNALQYMRDHFQAPLIIAAGDDHNDLKMLQAADIAIAIETAPPDVLAVADIVAKPAQNLGIIQSVKEAIALAYR